MKSMHCVICSARHSEKAVELAQVGCNVRAFQSERFTVWRCPGCASLHAREEVDLAHYYAGYPFHGMGRDPRLDLVYANFLKRLRRAGLRPESKILDYGCGNGALIAFLRTRGYEHVSGFDAYNPAFSDRSVLEQRYDCIIAQDVIEHVPSPRELLRDLCERSLPGAMLAVGTPDAARIDLNRAPEFIHALHMPYHRHILSQQALTQLATESGFRSERVYRSMYTNTFVPGFNEAFYRHYARTLDNTLDAIVGPLVLRPLLSQLPRTLWLAFFGGFFSRGTDPTVIFRRN